ncbi:hypothetical protein C7S18_16280 [Ahniella affigens]|uniref:Uncharacterized protein n=1 Tax=Ahniella affigens TaxID=2021234 RepID=A0A2P1PUY0_9GAMM|nr:hypothetical protein [Ahniella affigens]AVP98648.1 hypothetical protein C7S18_16280 [Ahniella affigens]
MLKVVIAFFVGCFLVSMGIGTVDAYVKGPANPNFQHVAADLFELVLYASLILSLLGSGIVAAACLIRRNHVQYGPRAWLIGLAWGVTYALVIWLIGPTSNWTKPVSDLIIILTWSHILVTPTMIVSRLGLRKRPEALI